MSQTEHIIYHQPRVCDSSKQGLMPARYSLAVQILSMAAFSLAFIGWLNETWLFWFENPIWLNRYTEYAIILCFGLWRVFAEQNSYTRKRLIILISVITIFWWLTPWLYPFYEPYIGFLWAQPVFPSLHVPGTITFFLILALVFLFGRRVICGFGCPCVGIRETVGFAFRDRSVRSEWAWKLRHSKWFFFIFYVGVMVVVQFPPNSWTVSFVGIFYLIVALTYFGTFFIAPIVGNRFYCRFLCPYGATFGLLNHAGFYNIKMDTDKCIDCQRCEQVCDMGIPVWRQGQKSGRVTGIEDCMGCARCVLSCPTDALEIQDVRNLFRPKMIQNASYLLKLTPQEKILRKNAGFREPQERQRDWNEIIVSPTLAAIQQQAARCLDCGMPGCINACPLSNRIPEWLEAVVTGDIQAAAAISHNTSNLPEICGRLCPQHRLCEGSCTKAKETDGAVTIGMAERYITDEAFKQGWQPLQTIRRNNKHIAVIGAGPAGLACADELNKAGCTVTVYDKQQVIGGLLATGVPSFKLEKSILSKRYQLLEQAGIKFQLGIEVDAGLIKNILSDSDAIFLGMGAQNSRDLQLEGQELDSVTDALTYLAEVNLSAGSEAAHKNIKSNTMSGKRVIVLGGGDSAMDCARSAIRQSAAEVNVVCRSTQETMRASPKEQQAARDEGVKFIFDMTPIAIVGETSVNGVCFNNIKGEQAILKCDTVISAFGQIPNPPGWLTKLDIKTDYRGVIQIDHHGRTSHPQIYAGGDNTNGPDLVVTAIAAGRLAAEGIIKSFQPLQRVKSSAHALLLSQSKQAPAIPAVARVSETGS